MILLKDYVNRLNVLFQGLERELPWHITRNISAIVLEKMASLGSGYKIFDGVAIHKSASIDSHTILKGPAIISANCFVGAHALMRGGVFLDESVSIGPGCEVKSSYIFSDSALAHFNFVGDSVVGSSVNLEAGAVVANHFNERKQKSIFISIGGESQNTGVEKFGAVIGDGSKVGANAVLSPGTILDRNTIVKRLELIDQSRSTDD
jgi:UDP-N-acetylglucosamine diphosphorylase / glucose-1-phosphate thymidylyltransferase / UDP-N-acetylgalactosamine diphosphorylase / glucosamine-1-phosphate N-acetyltransferase / galactosamine-1-phosphate N-acetyltransferase